MHKLNEMIFVMKKRVVINDSYMSTSPSNSASVIVIPSDWMQLLAIGNSVQSSDVEDTQEKSSEKW